jgi:dihydroorotate dehydrogenase subfamily 2
MTDAGSRSPLSPHFRIGSLFAPESAHRLALCALAAMGRRAADDALLPPLADPITLMGLSFRNRVGLAAGFDKNGTALDGIGSLGFGFVEIGTVTPRAQPGQPKPRLFRLTRDRSIINRLGFPSDGAEAVAARLAMRRYRGIVGINIGKNADTPIDRALDDYVSAMRTVYRVADYIAVNISSPNTSQLRSLQDTSRLRPFLGALLETRNDLAMRDNRRAPLLVKLSPDLSDRELADAAAAQRTPRSRGHRRWSSRRHEKPADSVGRRFCRSRCAPLPGCALTWARTFPSLGSAASIPRRRRRPCAKLERSSRRFIRPSSFKAPVSFET